MQGSLENSLHLDWTAICSAELLAGHRVVLAVQEEGTYDDMRQKQLVVSALPGHYYLLLLGLRQETRNTVK